MNTDQVLELIALHTELGGVTWHFEPSLDGDMTIRADRRYFNSFACPCMCPVAIALNMNSPLDAVKNYPDIAYTADGCTMLVDDYDNIRRELLIACGLKEES